MTKTVIGDLRQQALQAVRDADPDGPGGVRMQATKLLRDRTGGARHSLADLLAAVEWAQEQPADLSPYVAAHDPATGRTQYTFPNGHSATVIPDPRQPLRFEVFSDDPADAGRGHVVAGLTSDAAEAKLATVAALASPEPELTALVTVDERGHLTPDSTVTVGEFTWPVPEKAEHGGVLWASRVAQVLREHGYKPTSIDVNEDASPAGTVLVKVQPIEATD